MGIHSSEADTTEVTGAVPVPARIRVGIAGWSYDDWAGRVYPAPAPRGFDALAYLAQYVDCLEVNSSFYRPPTARAAESWVRRTQHLADFTFTVKLWQRFTHDRGAEDFSRDVKEFRDGIAPLLEANRCGALLLQFPWSFRHSQVNASWLARLCDAFADVRPVVEVRHASWNGPSVLRWFRDHGVGFCAIDQPMFQDSLSPAATVTGAVGYVRLHGRNTANWFREDAQVFERYDYLYDDAELDPWIARTREIAQGSDEVFVITNNHYQGQAVANALQISAALCGAPVPAPGRLRELYPQIMANTVPDAGTEPQGDLFG